MAGRWTLTLRNGPHFQRLHFDSLLGAMTALEQRLDELAPHAKREAIGVFKRQFDPVRQVVVRAEISGPGGWRAPRGGVDLRGDGSAESYTGRLRRRVVKLRADESPYEGLRRELEEGQRTVR
ncbi:MAG: hypothetical protein ACRDK2_09345 [Solirubrobacteraceae bacterium]